MARDINLSFTINSAGMGKFTQPIPNDVNFFRISFKDLKKTAQSGGVNSGYIEQAFGTADNPIDIKFFGIAPQGFNAIVDEYTEEGDGTFKEWDDKFTVLDYGGARCFNSNSTNGDALASGLTRIKEDGPKVVKNLVVSTALDGITKCSGGAVQLREFYGDIDIDGKSGSQSIVSLFEKSVNIQRAGGLLRVRNVATFNLMFREGGSTAGTWFNVLDLRYVDTSFCSKIGLLNHYSTPCTIILGNFSTEKLADTSYLMSDAPLTGRRIVMTTETPPFIKNCPMQNGVPQSGYDKKYDWVTFGNINLIYVPKQYRDNYATHHYGGNENIGVNGWSRYTSIMRTYDPNTQFLEKKEGGEHGRTIWLYRQKNR